MIAKCASLLVLAAAAAAHSDFPHQCNFQLGARTNFSAACISTLNAIRPAALAALPLLSAPSPSQHSQSPVDFDGLLDDLVRLHVLIFVTQPFLTPPFMNCMLSAAG